jgi:hypothetical protein
LRTDRRPNFSTTSACPSLETVKSRKSRAAFGWGAFAMMALPSGMMAVPSEGYTRPIGAPPFRYSKAACSKVRPIGISAFATIW